MQWFDVAVTLYFSAKLCTLDSKKEFMHKVQYDKAINKNIA